MLGHENCTKCGQELTDETGFYFNAHFDGIYCRPCYYGYENSGASPAPHIIQELRYREDEDDVSEEDN